MLERSIKVFVEPSIFKYARFLSGFNVGDVAKKSKIKQERIFALEQEGGEISIPQLRKLADVYKMPLVYFFLKEKPKDALLPKDFRIVYSSQGVGFTPSVMLAIRRARYSQFIIRDLAEGKIEYNFKHVGMDDNIERVASYFRSLLGVSLKEQSAWSDPRLVLREWKDAVERLGIFILQQSLPRQDVSAFSLTDQIPYLIVLNSSEHENRRVFSLFHEVGHILIRHSGVCTPDNLSRNSYEYRRIEIFCNQFAASLLVPFKEFVHDPIVQKLRKTPFKNWDSDDVRMISNRFKVSQEVIYRRLVRVGILTSREYERRREELIKGFREYKEKSKGRKIHIPQYIKIISQNGKAYSSFVLENLHSNRITLVDAADYLGTNSRHVLEVETHI